MNGKIHHRESSVAYAVYLNNKVTRTTDPMVVFREKGGHKSSRNLLLFDAA